MSKPTALFTAVFSTCVSLVLANTGFGQQWAARMFEEREHDFGTVARGADVVHRFPVKNIYKQDIHLTGVRSSCGCTSPSLEKEVLKSLETGYVVAKFNTRGFTGIHGATLTVSLKWLDDRGIARTGEAQLRVHGDIRGDLVFDPGAIRFGEVDQGQPTDQRVRVTYAGRSDWQIEDVLSKNEHLEVQLFQKERSPSRVSYDLLVRLKDSAPAGILRDQLILATSDRRNHRIPLLVEAKVVPQISVAPDLIVLGEVAQGDKTSTRILVRGKKPFRIVKVACDDRCFSFDSPDGTDDRHIVEVTFDAADSRPGKVKQAVDVITDLGENYRATFTVYATVVPHESGGDATAADPVSASNAAPIASSG